MESKTVYLVLPQSILVTEKSVTIKDIATVFCENPDITYEIEKINVYMFNNSIKDYTVISCLYLIQKIQCMYKDIDIKALGETETIVYYKKNPNEKKLSQAVKAAFLMLLTFLGTSYSIMSYNGDVGAIDLMEKLYTLFTAQTPQVAPMGFMLGIISYSLGLFIGMIVFFNHGFNKNSKSEPTPLQVQMRQYEKQINESIILDSNRKGKTTDVD